MYLAGTDRSGVQIWVGAQVNRPAHLCHRDPKFNQEPRSALLEEVTPQGSVGREAQDYLAGRSGLQIPEETQIMWQVDQSFGARGEPRSSCLEEVAPNGNPRTTWQGASRPDGNPSLPTKQTLEFIRSPGPPTQKRQLHKAGSEGKLRTMALAGGLRGGRTRWESRSTRLDRVASLGRLELELRSTHLEEVAPVGRMGRGEAPLASVSGPAGQEGGHVFHPTGGGGCMV